jgi:hypothetical protein
MVRDSQTTVFQVQNIVALSLGILPIASTSEYIKMFIRIVCNGLPQ